MSGENGICQFSMHLHLKGNHLEWEKREKTYLGNSPNRSNDDHKHIVQSRDHIVHDQNNRVDIDTLVDRPHYNPRPASQPCNSKCLKHRYRATNRMDLRNQLLINTDIVCGLIRFRLRDTHIQNVFFSLVYKWGIRYYK